MVPEVRCKCFQAQILQGHVEACLSGSCHEPGCPDCAVGSFGSGVYQVFWASKVGQRGLVSESWVCLGIDICAVQKYILTVSIAKGGTVKNWEESYKKAAKLVGQMSLVEKVNITTGIGWAQGFCVGMSPYPIDRVSRIAQFAADTFSQETLDLSRESFLLSVSRTVPSDFVLPTMLRRGLPA